ncbi:MAG: thioredoxin domain-containing protein [Verrucomicrobia bacterium]|nr:thioredoxin domain-containing protein [Verrucomicrobiota bacterium]
MGKAKRERENQAAQVPLTGTWTLAVRMLLFSAAIITAYLAIATLARGGDVPGCGPESDCDKVLNSSWAYWLGIPVSLLGLGLYGAFFISTFSLKIGQQQKATRSLNSLTLFSFATLAAAAWFVCVQAVAIKAFCPYCCTAHGLASLAALIFLSQAGRISSRLSVRLNFGAGIGVALGLVAVIAAGQIILPKEQTAPLIVDLGQAQTNAPIAEAKSAPKPTPPSTVEPKPTAPAVATVTPEAPSTPKAEPFLVPRSTLSLDAARLPLLGPANAPHRIGCLFDYTCHHCRQLHGFIRTAIVQFDGQLSCLMIPMPLDANCNAKFKRTHRDHVDACKYAKICLAVQQVAPAKYEQFDRWLFTNHKTTKPLAKVREHAAGLVGAAALNKAVASETVQQQLQQNIRVYELNTKNGGNSSMPQTIVGDRVIFGPPPSDAALQSILKKTLGLK